MNNVFSYSAADIFPVKLAKIHVTGNCDKIEPIHLQLCPTNYCNLNCSFCSCGNRNKKQSLSLEQIQMAIREYHLLNCRAVTITGGGEPLLHPDINPIISAIDYYGIKIGLVTNGTQFKRLSGRALNRLTWIRVSFSDERVFDGDNSFMDVEINSNKVDWAFSYVVGDRKKTNWTNIASIVRFANEFNFTHVRFVSDLLDTDMARSMNSIRKFLKNEKIDDSRIIYQGRKEPTKGQKTCLISLLKPVLAPDGNIYPCCGVQYALEEPSKDFEPSMCMGPLIKASYLFHAQRHFDGSNCVRCYYSEYNRFLEVLRTPVEHQEFV